MMEDEKELNKKTREEIIGAKDRIKSGRFLTHEEIEETFMINKAFKFN